MTPTTDTKEYSDGATATGPGPLPGQSPAQQDATEAAIHAAGANVAPRITPVDIEANITGEFYFTAADGVEGASGHRPSSVRAGTALSLLTFCVLVLRNGFTVTGESACASPANYNAEIGRAIARENAVNKIWPPMGYELRTNLAWREGPQTSEQRVCNCGPNSACSNCPAEAAAA